MLTLSPPIKLPEFDDVEIQFGFEFNRILSMAQPPPKPSPDSSDAE